MKPKLKPSLDLESIQSDLVKTVCSNYKNGVSVRALAKQMEISPMKARKILITGNAYATDLSDQIHDLWKDGKTVAEIAELLDMTTANVNSYLPYERIIYNMDERSVEADRQARYRERKKGLIPAVPEKEKKIIERTRNKTMIIVIGKKLRKLLPKAVFDDVSDPLSRDRLSWGVNELTEDPSDPDKMIWCAEVTTSGRGKDKKQGMVLQNANCGFTVLCPVPAVPDRDPDEDWSTEDTDKYRETLERGIPDAIRAGMLAFSLPEDRVLDYTDSIHNIEIVRGHPSKPGIRIEELIEQELKWEKGQDPLEHFNVRGNFTQRKFGNSVFYRNVSDSLFDMLEMDDVERKAWMDDFFGPFRERHTETHNSE